jgi:phage terminase Nu1 subunit (DNA packaging protein)
MSGTETNMQFGDQQDLIPAVDLGQIYLTTPEVAALYGVTERAVQLWHTERQWVSPDRRGLWRLADVILGVYEGQAAAINKKKGDAGFELDQLERREQRAKTERAEFELGRAREQFIDAAEVRRTAFEQGRTVRDAIENIPSRISALLAAETDTHKIKEMLHAELHQALETLTTEA